MIQDIAYLDYWFEENEQCFIIPYIEQNFHEASWNYEYNYMRQNLYFAKKIIQDYMLGNDEKITKLLNQFKHGKSKIITVIGGRGQGKTAVAMYCIEKAYKEGFAKKIYYIKQGERPEWLPNWINSAQTMEDVPNNSLAMLDETAIEYGSRSFWTDKNKSFTERLVVLRHKDISIFLITQHSKLVDINIRRLSDILIYKRGADIEQKKSENFGGGIQSKSKNQRFLILNRLMPKKPEESLIELRNTKEFYLINTGLPEFWNEYNVSKTYRYFNPEEMRRKERAHQIQHELDQHREKERIRAEEYAKKGLKELAEKPRMP